MDASLLFVKSQQDTAILTRLNCCATQNVRDVISVRLGFLVEEGHADLSTTATSLLRVTHVR